MSHEHSYIDKQIRFNPKDSKQVKALQSLGYVCNMMKGVAMCDGPAGYLDEEMAVFEDDIKAFIEDGSIDPKKVIASFEFNSHEETWGYQIFIGNGDYGFAETKITWEQSSMLYPFDPLNIQGGRR